MNWISQKPLGARNRVRFEAGAILAAFSLLLAACFITPGKFQSELVLQKNGDFSFSYEGEIFFLGLSKLAQMGAGAEKFEPSDCYDQESFELRECTADEVAEQREQWDANAQARQEKSREEAQQMAQFLGGIDPSDPEAAEELRQLLLRHKGWSKVEAKGNGVFEIAYATSGTLSHDMMFPIIEGIPTTNIFVQAILRDGELVRVNAPAFSADNGANPAAGMGAMAGFGAMWNNEKPAQELGDTPILDGQFTIRTDGEILANNTDEGAVEIDGYKILQWKISPRTQSPPTALIQLAQ